MSVCLLDTFLADLAALYLPLSVGQSVRHDSQSYLISSKRLYHRLQPQLTGLDTSEYTGFIAQKLYVDELEWITEGCQFCHTLRFLSNPIDY